jgi:hypothetical protein
MCQCIVGTTPTDSTSSVYILRFRTASTGCPNVLYVFEHSAFSSSSFSSSLELTYPSFPLPCTHLLSLSLSTRFEVPAAD